MSNGNKSSTASGTPNIASGTPNVASGTPNIASGTPKVEKSDPQKAGEGLREKRRRRDQGPDEAIEDLD
jgi:hypothetical protein